MRSLGEQTPLELVQSGLAAMAAADPVSAPDEQVRADLPALLSAFNQLAAVIAGVVGTFDARSLSEVDACRTTRTWLTAFGRMSQGAASAWLSRARLLRELPALAKAAGEGKVSSEQVAKVADLAAKIGVAAVRDYDRILADLAVTGTGIPAELGKACERVRALVDPDGPPPDPEAAFERRGLTIARSGSMFSLRGLLDAEGAAALLTALDALMKPPTADDARTAAQRRADAIIELTRLGLTTGQVPTIGGVRPQLGLLITPQTLLTGAGAGNTSGGNGSHAATEAGAGFHASRASHHEADHEGKHDADDPGGGGNADKPDDFDHDDGTDSRVRASTCGGSDPLSRAGVPPLPESPWMTWAGEIPTELAQRIACDCDVWRAILDPSTGLPLEVGRAHRIVPHWIRKALHARDRGCRWPGCDAPVSWTDAHHLLAWYYGGETNIANLLCVCRYHHARVHEGQWRLALDPATGEVHVWRPDGTPYELGPSQPWITPSTRRGDIPRTTSWPAAA